MKIVILGDLHIGVKNCSTVMINHQQRFFDQLFDYIDRHNIKTIIQLGDQNDTRKNVNYRAIDFAYRALFDRIEQNNIEYHTLIGNHDVFYKETLEITSSELLLRKYHNVHVHSEPTTLSFDNVTFDIIPWICNDNADQCFQYIKQSSSEYCCGHFAINSFPYFANVICNDGIDKSLFAKYKHVFSGHFHTRSRSGNITYVGTPYQLTWSDATTNNGFAVFDTITRTWEYVDNPDRYYFYLTYDDSKPHMTTDIRDLNLNDSFVKVIITTKNKPFLYANYLSSIFACKPADVKIIDQRLIDIQKQKIVDNQGHVKQTIDMIVDYIDNLNSPFRDQLVNLMSSLYNQAITVRDDIDNAS